MTVLSVYRSPKTEVRTGGIAGRGLFAIEPIQRDEIVAMKTGHLVRHDEMVELTRTLGDFGLQVDDDFYLTPRLPEEIDDLTVFINHSCDANVGFRGQISYVAIRDIQAGEELCHDYAMVRNDDYRLECRCGAADCRKIVTGQDWQLPAVQRKYGDYFSAYLLRKIQI